MDSTSDRPGAREAAHLASLGMSTPKGAVLVMPEGPLSLHEASLVRHLSPLLAEFVGTFFVCLMWAGLVPPGAVNLTTACMLTVRRSPAGDTYRSTELRSESRRSEKPHAYQCDRIT